MPFPCLSSRRSWILTFAFCLISIGTRAEDAPAAGDANAKGAAKDEKVEHMDPLTIKAEFSNIEVVFTLSRENIFNPLADPIARADIVRVEATDMGSLMDIQTNDELISINGTALKGHTLPEISKILTDARKAGVPVLGLRRGFFTFTVHHDGDWIIPLPGLKR